ncbi:MAG: hypothetical protein U9N53_01205, partial [Bacteroidota bacterium]|nr:hypothetical protein [Bacteroidota bacterium]
MKKLGFVIILLIVISHHGLSQIIQKDLNNEKTSLNEKGSGLCWESVGPFDNQIINKDNWIGRVSCLAADPNNQNIIYAGANTGGLWKTTNPLDASPHWECLTDDYAGMGVTDVLIDPNNSNIIYIVTGVHTNTRMHQLGDYKGDYSYGAYKSTDSGLTWNIMFGLDPEDQLYLKKIKYDPNNSNIMYILSSKAVYRSADGG